MAKKISRRIPASAANTKLEKHVRSWLNKQAANYSEGVAGAFKDLFHGGCSSGYVSHLVYTSEAAAFYRKHREDIAAIVAEQIESTGEPFELGDQWDKADPFANSDGNQNLLAWFGFEEAARTLENRMTNP